ncbi:hypothetical protein HOLleu_35705 [Holothuria leucospilota]|uniref:Reverse transcriptase n=1 Tax=Holothuria leucospilota TaxID=206669 RepID=A0A9Q0YJB6_HOLLE|nr:hypothetical protein HOLleu_35705 [Holothuria leucospilota]
MRWEATDVAGEFKLFKQRMELCFVDHGITDTSKQAIKIKIAVGNTGLRTINSSGLTTQDQTDPTKLWNLFESQLKIKVNFRIHRLELMNFRQKQNETLDEFVNRCRHKAKECDFTDDELSERIIELVIASAKCESFQRDLLDKPKGYSLDNVLKEGRKYEAISAGKQCLQSLDTGPSVSVIKSKKPCGNCYSGLFHPPKQCPAYNDVCKACGNKGHWAKMCQHKDQHMGKHTKPQYRHTNRNRGGKPVQYHEVNEDPEPQTYVDSYDSDDQIFEASFDIIMPNMCLDTINKHQREEAFTTLDVMCPELKGKHHLKLKIDTGANGNALPLRTVKQMYGQTGWKSIVKSTNANLSAYNGTKIQCQGTIVLKCRYNGSPWTNQIFFVVDVSVPAVAGLPLCEALKLVTILTYTARPKPKVTNVQDLVKHYPDRFDTIGSFKTAAKLVLKEDATPSIDPPRKCSIHLKDKLKAELDKMERDGIIRKVTHHTDWCSSLTTVIKTDGTLRVCLDPKRLNQNLKRCPHKIPTQEELNPAFAKANYFSKLDAKAGYWSVHLADESQELTTFRTPFGRYCFRRLPFGLSTSQDLFQQCMDDIISKVPGCVGIADDIIVFGLTEEEHDSRLLHLFDVAREEGLVFNSAKCLIKASQVNFFGSVYSNKGIHPDPGKVEDVLAMPTPQNKDDLQRFLGLMNFLSAYISGFAEKAAPLRDLLKKDVPFYWDVDHTTSFETLKTSVSADSCLQYLNPLLPTVLEVDASQKGMGACLLQDGKPIAFASKSLSSAQSNYSNIERETLALVFGINRFHTYLFGKHFTVFTDHKPLEMIWRKPLTSAPPRLQRLLIKVQGYQFDIVYKPGSSMVISDALSRLPNQRKMETDEGPNIDLINFGTQKQDALRKETSQDPCLRALCQVITTGWPGTCKELPTDLRPFWTYRDELGMADGVIFKGRQVLIPKPLHADILNQLHNGHQGIEKTRRLARESVYWPNINRDIEKLVSSCSICQELQPSQTREPLEPHEIPSTPWTKLATDLFTLDNNNYLLITDYHSKYPVVYQLRDTSSATVAHLTAETLSLLGTPREIISDNGPQLVGQPYQDSVTAGVLSTTHPPPGIPSLTDLLKEWSERSRPSLKNAKGLNKTFRLPCLT